MAKRRNRSGVSRGRMPIEAYYEAYWLVLHWARVRMQRDGEVYTTALHDYMQSIGILDRKDQTDMTALLIEDRRWVKRGYKIRED